MQPALELIPDDADAPADADADQPRPGHHIADEATALPAVVFGAASFSAFYNSDEHVGGPHPFRAIRLALRYGINAFDTAPYYGPSEIVLGDALKALEHEFPRSSYQLLTKCGRFGDTRADVDYTPAGVRASVQRSLARLHTSFLDTVYLHDVELVADARAPCTAGSHLAALGAERAAYGLAEGQAGDVCGDGDRAVLGALAALRALQSEGRVRRVGISGYPLPTLLRLAILVLRTTGTPLDAVMSYCHLTVQNRTLEAFAPALVQRAGVRHVVAASPFGMGLLGNPRPPAWHPASASIKQAALRAAAAHEARTRAGQQPPPTRELVLGYALARARQAQIPTVVGLSNVEEVHTCARVWHHVRSGIVDEQWAPHVAAMVVHFEQSNVLDHSWENPKLS